MSATQKFFLKLFGQSGDRTAVPDLTPTDGSISYEQGYGVDYQRAPTDPLVKNIERDKLNQVLFDLTLGLRQYQTHGFPEYIQPTDNGGAAFAYDKNAFVLWTDGQVYQSLAAANTSDPTDTTKWQLAILGTGVGAIQHFPAAVAPTGYVKANGAVLSRAAYPVLWAYAQASGNLAVSDGAWQRGQFSPGDGATTFRIPDARGYGIRSHDDGAGVDAGRVLGSAQADALAFHGHGLNDPGHAHAVSDPGHAHGLSDPGHAHGVNDPSHSHTVSDPGHAHGINDPGHAHSYTAALTGTPGGAEGGARDAVGQSNQATGASGTGISVAASGVGVGVNFGFANVSVQGAFTGQAVQGAGSNIGIFAAGTGQSVQTGGTAGETRGKNIALLACIKYM